MNFQMKAHKGRVLSAWRYTELFNLRAPRRNKTQTLQGKLAMLAFTTTLELLPYV